MIFEFENLGSIKKAELEVGNLTVICGKNNTGKTYLTYAVWGMLASKLPYVKINPKDFSPLTEFLTEELNKKKNIKIDLKKHESLFKQEAKIFIEAISKDLYKIFDSNKDFFKNTKIFLKDLNIDYSLDSVGIGSSSSQRTYNDKMNSIVNFQALDNKLEDYNIRRVLFSIMFDSFYTPFLLSAQRDAIHIFGNGINDYAKNKIRDIRISQQGIIDEKANNSIRYALPLEENLKFSTSLSEISKDTSFIYNTPLFEEIENILGVRYNIFHDSFTIEDKQGNITPSHLVSTSVRVLADLHFYLKHRAHPNHLLMIDEPELSLHPENQIKVARLLVKLVNAGLKVWITTHSDYIIKELNNCLMLSNEFKGKTALIKKLGYKKDEILKSDDLRYYTAVYDKKLEGCTLIRGKVGKYGVEAQSFDETLEKIVETSESIINAID